MVRVVYQSSDSQAQMYTGLMDSARQAGAKLQDVVQKVVRVLLYR